VETEEPLYHLIQLQIRQGILGQNRMSHLAAGMPRQLMKALDSSSKVVSDLVTKLQCSVVLDEQPKVSEVLTAQLVEPAADVKLLMQAYLVPVVEPKMMMMPMAEVQLLRLRLQRIELEVKQQVRKAVVLVVVDLL